MSFLFLHKNGLYYENIYIYGGDYMITDAERRLVLDLELLHDKWTREWAEHVKDDTHPTREDERRHLLELRRVIIGHLEVDIKNLEMHLK